MEKDVGARKCTYGSPWKYDATCFNFRVPEETLIVSDIHREFNFYADCAINNVEAKEMTGG